MKYRLQIDLKALLLIVAVCAAGLFVAEIFLVKDVSKSGVELVEIQVLDAGSDQPISDAKLQSTEPREQSPKTSNQNGIAAFAHSYDYRRIKSLFRDRCKHGIKHKIKITAEGYRAAEIDIETFRLTGKNNFRLPSSIVVRLIPKHYLN